MGLFSNSVSSKKIKLKDEVVYEPISYGLRSKSEVFKKFEEVKKEANRKKCSSCNGDLRGEVTLNYNKRTHYKKTKGLFGYKDKKLGEVWLAYIRFKGKCKKCSRDCSESPITT